MRRAVNLMPWLWTAVHFVTRAVSRQRNMLRHPYGEAASLQDSGLEPGPLASMPDIGPTEPEKVMEVA